MKWGKGSHARQYSPVYWWALQRNAPVRHNAFKGPSRCGAEVQQRRCEDPPAAWVQEMVRPGENRQWVGPPVVWAWSVWRRKKKLVERMASSTSWSKRVGRSRDRISSLISPERETLQKLSGESERPPSPDPSLARLLCHNTKGRRGKGKSNRECIVHKTNSGSLLFTSQIRHTQNWKITQEKTGA